MILSKIPCVIFDIDGTLAKTCPIRHQYILTKPRNWDAWYATVYDDAVHEDIVFLLNAFHAAGRDIFICSGRREECRLDTVRWLDEKADLSGKYVDLLMRPKKDHRDDCIIKKEMLDHIRSIGYEPTMAFDDRDRVVIMWRDNGIRCLQVASGNF